MATRSHPKRPYGWFGLVHQEYIDVYREFPDASERLVCSMLKIEPYELRYAIHRYRSYRRTHRWSIRARAAQKRHEQRRKASA